MFRRYPIILIAISLLLWSCSDSKKTAEVDSLYQFRNYIGYHTHGQISVASEVKVVLNQPLPQFELQQELPANYLQINPAVAGTLLLTNSNTLLFTPQAPLEPGMEYKVSLQLNKFYPDISKELQTYSFAFKTLDPNFKINLDQLQSYSPDWQYLKGTLQGADLMPTEKVKQLIKASMDGKNLKIIWDESDTLAQYFLFTIDSIPRTDTDGEISVSWSGKAIGAETNGTEKFPIPGKDKFVVIDAKTTASPSPTLTLNFSEPLDENQNLNGLVTLENDPNPRFEIQGNVLRVYPSTTLSGQVRVKAFNGIKNSYGNKLSQEFSELISFEQLKPAVRLISKGTILPNAAQTPIYFETVNLSAIEVRVIKIYQDNILQHLQQSDLGVGYAYDLKKVGRRVAFKVLDFQDALTNQWQAHALDLSTLVTPDPGALYRIEFKFNKAHSLYQCDTGFTAIDEEAEVDYPYDEYDEEGMNDEGIDSREAEEQREERFWDDQLYSWRRNTYDWRHNDNPCHTAYYNQDREAYTHVLGSNLGLIIKKGNNGTYHVYTTDLLTAQPQMNAQVTFYNYQQQPLATLTTDSDGHAIFDAEKQASFVMAKYANNYTYAKLEDGNALNLSQFDVSGQTLQKGLQGFLYTERGVHRPGDTLHLTFVLDDKNNPLPQNHPVVLEVTDTRGKMVQRTSINGTANANHTARKTGRFYYFPITTAQDAPTGSYRAKIYVGGAQFSKTLKIATVKPNRLKIDLAFDQEVLPTDSPTTGNATVSWLHGAPARNLPFEMDVKLRKAPAAFAAYPNYHFNDPVRSFDEADMPFFKGGLNEKGQLDFTKKIELGGKAPGMLQATFTTKAFEGGGDFSVDVFSKNLAPFTHFVGLRSPDPDRWGSYPTESKTQFNVVSVDANGKASGHRRIKVSLYKIEWRWWWNRGFDNLSRYENSQVHRPVQSFEVTTQANGKTNFDIAVPDEDGGRYLLRLEDIASGHATGITTYFYKDWWKRPNDGATESSKIVLFSTDKDTYAPNETAWITFPSSQGGKALVTVENGSEVLFSKWVETQNKETRVNLPITPEMAPNAFINLSLLQPHGKANNDLPIRMYGIVPFKVEDPQTVLNPKLQLPEFLEPNATYTLKVSEANKKAMTYTVAVVDEGLLDLTRFTTPDAHAAFYAKQALGVKTFDVFDEVMGSYSVSIDNIYAIGGGDMAAGAKNRKAQRFQPVVSFLGPFELKEGETASHRLTMPNYVGAVRAMVVAGNAQSAYGLTEKSVAVRKPLMVLASIPRKLSPGEKVTIPVTVFVMENKVKNAQIQISAGKALQPLGNTTQSLSFSSVGEKMVYFDFEVGNQTGIQKIKVEAQGGGEVASYEIEIDVENPNPLTTKTMLYELPANGLLDLSYATFGTVGSNTAGLELSTLPPMNIEERLTYLVQYPHGCLEQTTSAAFPQLFLPDILDLTFERKKEMEDNIKAAIRQLGERQQPEGGLVYWPGAPQADDWGTSYAGHFMVEAKNKGYALPLTFMTNWVRYQKKAARLWSNQQTVYHGDHSQAYRLYTLALAGEAELAAMNRLRESKNLSNNAKWRLAAAYAVMGKANTAKELVQSANIDFQPNRADYHTYGSVFRNRAMALETLVLLEDGQQRQLAQQLAKNLSSSSWYSTQETAYALLALAKMVEQNGGRSLNITLGNTQVTTEKSMVQRGLSPKIGANSVRLKNNADHLVYVNVVQTGQLPLGEEMAQAKGLQLSAKFLDGEGQPLDVNVLRQGTEVTAQLLVYNPTADTAENVALSQIFPSGWEMVNTSFTDAGMPNSAKADHIDLRDDRANYYFDLPSKTTKSFKVNLNASFIGRYYLPGAQAEAMYDNDYYARTKGQWVEVIK